MFNPAPGRVTSEYGNRVHPLTGRRTLHAGIDIANAVGTPVVAAYAGTVEKAGKNIVAGRTGNGVLVRNPDGERQYYGHLSQIDVKKGQKVAAGEQLGLMGATGQVTGPHLHFETWNASGSTRNPRHDFRHYGVTPGVNVNRPDPAPNPRPPADVGTLRRGSRGARVKALQLALNKWKSDLPRLVPDGEYGARTEARVREWQRRNHGGAYPRTARVDGIAGPITLRALGLAF